MGHSHDHGHSHGVGHSHIHTNNKKVLLIAFVLITLFMIVEVIGGILTNSLALLADAGHMLSDAVALGLALAAFKYGERAASNSKTYGYKRFEILAAFINGLTLIGISGYIIYEAISRFAEPPEVASVGMLVVAVCGLLINMIVAWILMRGSDVKGNLNMRGAFLHVLGDLLGSVGAIAAGLLMLFFGWSIADPIASLLVAALILVSGFRVTRDSVHVLMEGKPASVDVDEVKNELQSLPGVLSIHDLHTWSITSDFPALTAHVVVGHGIDRDDLLKTAKRLLHDRFGIHHTTLQLEGEEKQCNHSCN